MPFRIVFALKLNKEMVGEDTNKSRKTSEKKKANVINIFSHFYIQNCGRHDEERKTKRSQVLGGKHHDIRSIIRLPSVLRGIRITRLAAVNAWSSPARPIDTNSVIVCARAI